MKSARIPKYISIPLLVVVIIGIFFGIIPMIYVFGDILAIIDGHISPAFISYMKENKAFPISEDDLMSKGYLTKEKQDYNNDIYYLWHPKPSDKTEFRDLPWFKSFVFYYGFNPQEVELKEGKLYHKTTKQQILLIQGPDDVFLRKYYEDVSRDWYLLLMEKGR